MNSIAIAIVASALIFSVCIAAGVFFGMKYFSQLVENLSVLKVAERPEDVARIKNALAPPEKGVDLKKVMQEAEAAVSVDSLGTYSAAMKNIHSRQ